MFALFSVHFGTLPSDYHHLKRLKTHNKHFPMKSRAISENHSVQFDPQIQVSSTFLSLAEFCGGARSRLRQPQSQALVFSQCHLFSGHQVGRR